MCLGILVTIVASVVVTRCHRVTRVLVLIMLAVVGFTGVSRWMGWVNIKIDIDIEIHATILIVVTGLIGLMMVRIRMMMILMIVWMIHRSWVADNIGVFGLSLDLSYVRWQYVR